VSAPIPSAAARDEGLLSPAHRRTSAAIFTVIALSAFEGLAVAAALPRLAADLGGIALLPWVVTAYLLPSGVATVAAGALVDRLGVARVFRGAVVVFTAGGALAGVAPTIELVVAARVLQGIGSGAVVAVGLAATALAFPPRLVGRAFAANSTVWGVMSVAGPAIAAGLLAVGSWRWIFLLNVPLGAVSLLAGRGALPEGTSGDAADRPRIRLDPLALLLLTVTSTGLLVAVDRLDLWSLPALALTAAAGVVLLRRERGRPGALVAPRHLVDAPLGPLALAVCLLLTGSIGLATFIPLYLTAGRGVGATAAAWSVVFFTLGWTGGANASSRLQDRRPAIAVTRAGAVLTPAALAVVAACLALDVPVWLLVIPVTVAGVGMGATTNSALSVLREATPDDELGRATAAHQYVRNIGFATGNAMVGAVLLLVVATTTGDVEGVRAVLAEGAVDAGGQAVAAGVRDGLAVAVAVGAVVAATAILPLRRARRALTADRIAGPA
jgi:MFS family permease